MGNAEDDRKNEGTDDVIRVCRLISAALDVEEYDRAAALIESAEKTVPTTDMHRVVGYKALLRRKTGAVQESIDLMRQACDLAPTWLPHFAFLAYYLEDAEQWAEAEPVFDELIRLSEEMDEPYFLDDARFGKMICLKNLNRDGEIAAVKAKIKAGANTFRPSGVYRLEDFF